jgi:hypothetical protein
MTYQFDDVEIDLARLELRRGGQAVAVDAFLQGRMVRARTPDDPAEAGRSPRS